MKSTMARSMSGALISTLIFATSGVFAQDAVPVSMASTAEATLPSQSQYSPQQLDQMLAPIALYPDPLVAQILMAATYPLEVVEADRWVVDPANAGLQGDELATALDQQTWDPSVKSLVPFPQILNMMNGNLDWMESMGEAFLANQGAVMDSVQRLRQQAEAAGNLNSNAQQVVDTQGQVITIEPASPDTVYVPVYDPGVVYGAWPYPAYPPYYFPGFFGDGLIVGGFGFSWFGVIVVRHYWGWHHWDWRGHRLDINRDRYASLNHDRPPAGNAWSHDPSHRLGVPYTNSAVRQRFGASAGMSGAHQEFRGFVPNHAEQFHQGAVAGGNGFTPGRQGFTPGRQGFTPERQPMTMPEARSTSPSARFFGHGVDERGQAQRGGGGMRGPGGMGRGGEGGGRGFGEGR